MLYFLSALRFAARKPLDSLLCSSSRGQACGARKACVLSIPSTYEAARAGNAHVLPQRTGLLSVVPCRGLVYRYSHITALLKLLNSTDRFRKRSAAQCRPFAAA